jgi:hypothetical protein
MTFSPTEMGWGWQAGRVGGSVTHKLGAPLALRLLLDGRWAH